MRNHIILSNCLINILALFFPPVQKNVSLILLDLMLADCSGWFCCCGGNCSSALLFWNINTVARSLANVPILFRQKTTVDIQWHIIFLSSFH